MNKEKFEELAYLYLFNEIDTDEKIIFENYLLEDDKANAEFESIKSFYLALTENKPELPDESLIESSRQSLLRQIRSAGYKKNIWEKLADFIHEFFYFRYRAAIGGVVTLAAGIFIGYFLLAQNEINTYLPEENGSIDIDKLEERGVDISNIRFPNPFTGEGDIEFRFDAVQPISYKGKPDDEFTQRLLAMALLTSNNPGTRLKTLNTIASQTNENFIPDPKVKKALITSLKIDDNPAVRREALNVLKKFPYSEDIRDAFLYVLTNDDNSGLRVAAINALSDLSIAGISIDEKIKNELIKRAESDENEFIKLRAASLLREVK